MPFELDAPDLGLGERKVETGHVGADRCEHALHAGACVRRAANHLQALLAGIDFQHLQLVSIWVPLGLHDLGHPVGFQRGRGVEHLLDLKPNAGKCLGDLLHGRLRVEMLLQPCEGEFH